MPDKGDSKPLSYGDRAAEDDADADDEADEAADVADVTVDVGDDANDARDGARDGATDEIADDAIDAGKDANDDEADEEEAADDEAEDTVVAGGVVGGFFDDADDGADAGDESTNALVAYGAGALRHGSYGEAPTLWSTVCLGRSGERGFGDEFGRGAPDAAHELPRSHGHVELRGELGTPLAFPALAYRSG